MTENDTKMAPRDTGIDLAHRLRAVAPFAVLGFSGD